MNWQEIIPNVFLWRDSCNVYAVVSSTGVLVVNAGTGAWLDALTQLPVSPRLPIVLVCTHFFRDHAAGAARASRAGIAVFAPEGEREIFSNPSQHFHQRDTYIIYDNYWDLFAPIEPTPLAGVLQDYAHITLAGIEIEIVPLPGVTVHHTGISVKLNNERIVFCGEAIHSHGKVARVAPYQYNYNDLHGAVAAYASAKDLHALQPDVLLPSLGTPMFGQQVCASALTALQGALVALCAERPDEHNAMQRLHTPEIEQVTPHVWRTTQTQSVNWFIVSDSGKALAIDYGYQDVRGAKSPLYSKPYRRRALLHSLGALRVQTGISKIDVVLVSHFHDDHVCGIPLLQRLHGTQCWATENVASLLTHPQNHNFPCNWPQASHVHRQIGLAETVQWEEYAFHFAPMSGHTRFASLIGFEADGKKFAHTGDQYFFLDAQQNWIHDDTLREWSSARVMHNEVFRNGALLNGFAQSGAWLRRWQPDIVLNGHQYPFYTNSKFFDLVDEFTQRYETVYEAILPLDNAQPHFDLDNWGGWITPYRTHLPALGTATVTVIVRNPFAHAAELSVRLVGAPGWVGTAQVLSAAAHAEISCQLHITPNTACFRQAFAVELTANGQPFGQVAEAQITVGGEGF